MRWWIPLSSAFELLLVITLKFSLVLKSLQNAHSKECQAMYRRCFEWFFLTSVFYALFLSWCIFSLKWSKARICLKIIFHLPKRECHHVAKKCLVHTCKRCPAIKNTPSSGTNYSKWHGTPQDNLPDHQVVGNGYLYFINDMKNHIASCLCSSMFLKQSSKRYKKNLSPFLSFQTGILTNKSHFKETRSLKYLNFPAKLQAELFDVTHTLLAPRWRRSVVEFWATLEKDFVGI